MTTTIEVKTARTMFGKKAGGFVASLNGVDVRGETRESAKQNLLDYLATIERQHMTRRYLFCADGTVLSLYWCGSSWAYDIISAERAARAGCLMATTDERQAIRQMEIHADQSYGGVIKVL